MAFAPPPVTMNAQASSSPAAVSSTAVAAPRYTLYSIPISFYAARVRYLVYREPVLASAVTIAAPPAGSLKSDEHLAVNPLGKVPSLAGVADAFSLFESQAIATFLLDEFGLLDQYTHETPKMRARVNLLSAFVDNQISPLNRALYRGMSDEQRTAEVAQIVAQLDVLESLIDSAPYAVGDKLTMADVNLFGVFLLHVWAGPLYFGYRPNDAAVRPKLTSWFETMCKEPAAVQTLGEVHGALEAWREGGRWKKLGVPEVPMSP
jgi:glutathione S-transferase